jgi:hypothetical protein
MDTLTAQQVQELKQQGSLMSIPEYTRKLEQVLTRYCQSQRLAIKLNPDIVFDLATDAAGNSYVLLPRALDWVKVAQQIYCKQVGGPEL